MFSFGFAHSDLIPVIPVVLQCDFSVVSAFSLLGKGELGDLERGKVEKNEIPRQKLEEKK
jgi:hypothetical protein